MTAVGRDGLALAHASAVLQEDVDVVLAAVENCWKAVLYASAGPRGNRRVMLAAVQQNGLSLRFASAELRAGSRGGGSRS